MKVCGTSQASQPCCSSEVSALLPGPLARPRICLVASVSLGQITGPITKKASYCHGACFPSVFEVLTCFCSVAGKVLRGHDCGNCWRLSPGPARCWVQLSLCLYTKGSSWESGRLEVTPAPPGSLGSLYGACFLNCPMKAA